MVTAQSASDSHSTVGAFTHSLSLIRLTGRCGPHLLRAGPCAGTAEQGDVRPRPAALPPVSVLLGGTAPLGAPAPV